ncbi:ATP-binding protein [Marinobacterium sp. LSUCC0821]|jgi:signal transduction histidine kinase|uniref:ATP-binding protein n=1 Tax=Marinobacterium sp. LSUCC0821 TaxID=2668067 RepID=UPI0014510FE6|nr:ATP-binding protein [Marinobacterium sp. LSUCC0821]QJD71637.1 HAMP domain-containing protein [Marinobacterium sp. LSUCC0821]
MIGFCSSLRDKVLPKSIIARMSLMLLFGIIFAQVVSTVIWSQQFQASERHRLEEISDVMGARIGQTIQFFSRLPKEYRHIVLDQLRDMGGTRFFVSVNPDRINLKTLPVNSLQTEVGERISSNVADQIKTEPDNIAVEFVGFSDLRILSTNNLMVELPKKWQRFALLDPGDNSPVVVVQLPLKDGEWIYLATVFPEGEVLSSPILSSERILSLTLVTLTTMVLVTLMVIGIVKPLRRLAKEADALGRGKTPSLIPVEGTREMRSTIKAFNQMAQRIEKFIADRERLFASISHDLKTPLTRARLRAEMIDDDHIRDGLVGDLENLEMLVKASLQMIKDAAIHENIETVDLNRLIQGCLASAKIEGLPCEASLPAKFEIEGRRLSLERLFTNLIDNALHYGRGVEIYGEIAADTNELVVQVCDRGPGLSDAMKQRVFEPFYRIDKQPSSIHVGLGMGIVKSIAQLHGADTLLLDRPGGGLIVEIRFPLSHFVTEGQSS